MERTAHRIKEVSPSTQRLRDLSESVDSVAIRWGPGSELLMETSFRCGLSAFSSSSFAELSRSEALGKSNGDVFLIPSVFWYFMSCTINPAFGLATVRLSLMNRSACTAFIRCFCIKYALQTVTERDIPAKQWTSTLPPLCNASSMNS